MLGFFAGTAWITGYTLLGLEVEDEFRGRTFAFVQTLIRLTLALVLALAPLIAGLIGQHRWQVTDDSVLDYNGAAITMFGSAVVMVLVGLMAYHSDERQARRLDRERAEAVPDARQGCVRRPWRLRRARRRRGSGQVDPGAAAARVARRAQGYEVVLTHEPGDSDVGRAAARDPALSRDRRSSTTRAEALLYAADKAEHVEKLVRPALARGAVVITDRYVDSTLAYQGAGRDLRLRDVERVARWATADLRPHLTVLLDLAPEVGFEPLRLARPARGRAADFHQRVRESFLQLAAAEP